MKALTLDAEVTHRWEYCDMCEADVVICGFCGNNCCNGGYGELMDDFEIVQCPYCPSAYEMHDKGKQIK